MGRNMNQFPNIYRLLEYEVILINLLGLLRFAIGPFGPKGNQKTNICS
jgi:hypothetical protein